MNEELIQIMPAVRRFAFSLTGSHADADDLLQSTVERVLSRGVPADVELPKWVFRVCRNLWIDEYRSRKVRQTASEDPDLSEAQIVDGERQIHGEIGLDQVNRAMDKLSDDQRSVLSLVALQGFSYQQVADTLSIPTGTVMSRLARARVALSQILHCTNGSSLT